MSIGRLAIVECVGQAAATLRGHPLRTALAAAAMAAAVATMAVIQTGLSGLARSARETSARVFGADTFVLTRVAAGTLSRRELAERLARNPPITAADVRFLEQVADDQVVYAATAQRTADIVRGARRFERASVTGARASLFDIRDVGIARGRAFTPAEDRAGRLVVVAGSGVAEALFPDRDPIGQVVRIAGRGFVVVGVTGPQGNTGGVSLDRYVWLPLTAFERAFGPPETLQVFARAAGDRPPERAEDRARISMRARRHLGPDRPDTFDLVTPEASRSFVAAITERLGAAGPPISLMALLAAMVVVANTTLVSVTQRTREIGIRRAVGATRGQVLSETVTEALLVAVAGGLAGLGLAGAIGRAATSALDLPLALEWPVAAGSLAAAAAGGLLAGWLPARRASRLNIIEALRQE